ncbi:MAG TPA: DUF4381 family protein [Gemmataceae bacterium]|nr:DUF4381 family protein [Gemmataceae bacterium]
MPLLLLLVLAVASPAGPAPSGEAGVVLPEQSHGGMTARLAIHAAETGPQPGAALVRLTLTVVGGPLLEVERPELSDPLNAWQAEDNASVRLDGDRATWTTTMLLRQIKPGPASLPDVKVRFRNGPEAAWEKAEWVDPLKRAQAAPPPEFLPPPVPWSWTPWAIAAAAVAVLAAAACWIGLRRRQAPPRLTPQQLALQDLNRLDGAGTIASAAYHTQLSDVVRRYLADQFELPATTRTTAEFLDMVNRSGRLPPGAHKLLQDFLQRCDLAKFAPVGAAAGECQAAAALARSLVEQTAGLQSSPQTAAEG